MLTYTIFGIKAYKLAIAAAILLTAILAVDATRGHSGSHHSGGSQMCSAH